MNTEPSTSNAFSDPYQAPPADAQPSWLGGTDAATSNALANGAGAAAFQDPYQATPADAHPAWLGGPQAVTHDATASGDGRVTAGASQGVDPGTHGLSSWFDGALPVQGWINDGLGWFVVHFRPAFQALRQPVDALLGGVEAALLYPSTPVMIGLLSLLAWQLAGARLAVATLVSLMVIGLLGIWPEAMVTLSLVLTALFFCVLIGLPLGVWLARSERANRIVRPLLDAMQTTPAFVYLVPVVMLFGIGNVLALLGIAVVLWITPPEPAHPVDAPRGRLADVWLHPHLWRLDLGVFVLHTVQMAMWGVVPALLLQAGVPKAEHWHVYLPAVGASFVLLGGLFALERRGQLRAVLRGAVALMVVVQLVLLVLAPQQPGVWALGVTLFGFFVAFNILEASQPSLISRLAPAHARGAALGVYNTLQSLGLFAGGALGGLVLKAWGPQGVFAATSALALLWLLLGWGQVVPGRAAQTPASPASPPRSPASR